MKTFKILVATKEAVQEKEDVKIDHPYQLILYNDDINSFDDVIEGLMTICKMDVNMAVKTAMEAHTKGRTIAHVGSKDECQIMKDQLQNEYCLTVDIEPI